MTTHIKDIQNKKLEQQFETFYALVRPKPERKKRSCLKCKYVFISQGPGNRFCSNCAKHNSLQSVRMANISIVHHTNNANFSYKDYQYE